MKTIPLSRGLVALVDDEDYERLARFKWHASGPTASGQFYAARESRTRGLGGGRKSRIGRKVVYMHREVQACEAALVVDHRDGNGLNNTRENLRVVTPGKHFGW